MDEEMRGAAGTMETRSEITMNEIKRDIDHLRSDLKVLMSGRFKSRERLAEAKSRLWDTAHNLESRTEEQFRDVYNTIRQQGQKAVETGREYVEKRPFTSVLSALGLGIVLGGILLRR